MTLRMMTEVPNPQIPVDFLKLDLLPSRFKVYPQLFLRKLTVKEVKQLASSTGSIDDIARIVGGAITPIPFRELALGDLRYVIALLKTTTFRGSYWTVSNLHCPHCKHVNSKIVYDKDLQFKDLDEDVELPITYSDGDLSITIHDVFRVKHQIYLESLYKKKLLTEIKDNSLDVLAVLMIEPETYTQLESESPEKLEELVLENYKFLSELPGEVTNDLDTFLDVIYFDVDTNLKHTCKACTKEFDFELNIGSIEHFFPESQSREHIREKIRFGVQKS